MWEDTIVAEVHRAREALAAGCNYDIGAYFSGLRERQKSLGDRLISPKERAEPLANAELTRLTNSQTEVAPAA